MHATLSIDKQFTLAMVNSYVKLFIEYDRDLLKDVKDDTSGHFRRMFVSLLQVLYLAGQCYNNPEGISAMY